MLVFAVLSTRKRALVALVHAAAFLGLAVRDFAVSSRLSGILTSTAGTSRSIAFAAVYLAVTVVLAYLLRISGCVHEQLYFGFCTASAATGLLRATAGDAAFPAGQYLRMALLACAVLTGLAIMKIHSGQAISVGQPSPSAGEPSES